MPYSARRWTAIILVTVLGLASVSAYVVYRHLRHSRNHYVRKLMGIDWDPVTMTSANAASAERDLMDDPNDLSARATLIGYYDAAGAEEVSSHQSVSTVHYRELEEKREQHVLWLIEHHPECECLASSSAWLSPDDPHYAEAKELWLRQVNAHGNDIAVLANAASSLHSNPELSRQFATRFLAVQPNNTKMLEILADSYTREMRFTDSVEERRAFAVKAIQAWEACAAAGGGGHLPDLAISAFESGDLLKAKQYATQLLDTSKLKDEDLVADNLHIANTVLGRLALRNGDIEEAKRRLLASAPEHGSAILNSYGPRMSLAAELLDRGQRDVVVAYLDKCARFWKFDHGQLSQWKAEIRAGKKPDFGDNIRP
jgi:hypothetical protein